MSRDCIRLARTAACAVFFVVLVSGPAVGQAFHWKPSGPRLLFEEAFADPSSPGTLTVVSRQGLYRSIDDGKTWSRLGWEPAELPGVWHPDLWAPAAVIVDPADCRRMWVAADTGGYGGGVLASLDGGGTFGPVRLAGWSISGLAYDAETVTLWAAPYHGEPDPSGFGGRLTYYHSLWYSRDGGASWERPESLAEDLGFSRVAASGGRVYGLPWNGDGLWRSIDGGATWEVVDLGPDLPSGRGLVVDPGDPDRLRRWSRRKIFESEDGGTTWREIGPPVARGGTFNDLEIAAGDWQRIWISVERGWAQNLQRTADGGKTWTLLRRRGGRRISALAGTTGRLWIDDREGVRESLDGGVTWKRLTSLPGPRTSLVATARVDGRRVFLTVEAGGRTLRSVDGKTWNATQAFGYGDPGASLRSHPSVPSTVWIAWQGTGRLSRSLDGGLSWQSLPAPQGVTNGAGGLALHPRNPDVLWLAAGSSGLWHSEDGAETWQEIVTPESGLLAVAVDPATGEVVFVGTSNGKILRSSDGGTTWSELAELPAPVLDLALDPFHPGVVLAGTGGRGARRSLDGGATWEVVRDLRHRRVGRIFHNDLQAGLVLAATDIGVYRSTDGGDIWHKISRGLGSHQTYDVTFDPFLPQRPVTTTDLGIRIWSR